jgi:error-prone DNA polymerase
MSADLTGVGERDDAFPLRHGRGDKFHHGGSPDARGLPPKKLRTRNIYIPYPHNDSIKVKTRGSR